MNVYSQTEVAELLQSVGMNRTNAKIGSAIAMCEAPAVGGGADFDLVGDLELVDDTWGPSYGAFQVRSLKSQTGTGGIRDADQLGRPRFNARSARAIKLQSGWRAWSTYTSGMFRAYLQDIYPPAPGSYVVIAGDTLSTIAASLGGFSWEDLARVNGIHEPYTVYIGQTLTLP